MESRKAGKIAIHKAGRGMLSALVVHKDGDMELGSRILRRATEIGKDVSDRLRLWVAELHKCTTPGAIA